MIRYAEGNLLEADVEALVNTVNTVGIMGKGIALMFKEAFPENFRLYAAACKRGGEVEVGRMFVTERPGLVGPRWIINFPTKKHWRDRTRIEWIRSGLEDLKKVLLEKAIRSIALPPLGCGNGGLEWSTVRPLIEQALAGLSSVEVVVFEPTARYQNVAKRVGVETLTPARALIAELVRRYWILGIECSLLEIQKLAWFLEREIVRQGLDNPLGLDFVAHRYGPYADRLRHLLDGLDGSYLRSEVRIPDAKPTDVIAFDDTKRERVALYLKSEAKAYLGALERTSARIDGFESPLGMELLSTIDWLLSREGRRAELDDIKAGLASWSGGRDAGERKLRIFDDRLIRLALERLSAAAASI
ncbi:MAG TPA: macro domain-containing protein [Thermoanaerobaculia bacterium]|jgi:O-acetyl-ADP-ribose deacetylase (regulator of RNase III)|nr:macro domain-containing protein [Thermoanaerobaculia bacterium]